MFLSLTFYFLILQFVNGQDLPVEETRLRLCEVCTCSEIMTIDRTHVVLNVQCSLVHKLIDVPDLNKIEWPENPNNLKVSTTFEGLRLSTLSKLPPNLELETLVFINDAIDTYWPDPFSDVSNLLKLSLYQNELTQITPDLFTNLKMIEELDLSFNKLSEFNPVTFKSLKTLKKLNLQGNKLNKIPIEALKPMRALEDLDISKNGIYDLLLKRSDGEELNGIKWLSLNGNRIRSVMKGSFPQNNSIEYLDLSNNLIEIIEEEAFLSCTNLRELNLAQNNITLVFALPDSLQIAIFKVNLMYHMPKFPTGITFVDMSYNRLMDFNERKSNTFDNLEVLNVAGNQIRELKLEDKLPKLFTLDISFNLLQEIPEDLSSNNFPNLKELRLDGNPMHTVYFKNIIALRSLYMNDLQNLSLVEEKAFSNVLGRNVDENNNKTCTSVALSNCKSLSTIARGAFDGTNLCMLDLSHNNLAYIPADLVDWNSLPDGVDLQYNPWNCNCSLQWILQDLMPVLYDRTPYLLNELRCQYPRGLQGLHFVHMYNWTEPILCQDSFMDPIEGSRGYLTQSSTKSALPVMDQKNIIILSSIVVLAIIAIILIIYIIVTKKYKRVKPPPRRQSDQDLNHNREEAVRLNEPLKIKK